MRFLQIFVFRCSVFPRALERIPPNFTEDHRSLADLALPIQISNCFKVFLPIALIHPPLNHPYMYLSVCPYTDPSLSITPSDHLIQMERGSSNKLRRLLDKNCSNNLKICTWKIAFCKLSIKYEDGDR
jgi:hypothetical protein